MIRRTPLAVLALGFSLLLAACDTATSPSEGLSLPPEARSPFFSVQHEQSIQTFARAIARGLTSRSAREGLYEALQASPLVEHKVSLMQLLDGESGLPILEAMGRATRMQGSEVRAFAQDLPPLDVYLPHSQHRETWRPSEPIAVAALLDREGQIVARVGERTFAIDRRSTDPTPTAVLLLAPVEPKGIRPELVRSLSEPIETECPPDCSGGGPGPGPALAIDTLITYNVCDNNFCWETNEFKIRATDSNGLLDATWTCSGIEQFDVVRVQVECPSTRVHDSAPSEVAYVDANVIETDGWPNPDDNWVDYLTPPQGYVWHDARVVDNAAGRAQFDLYLYPDGANYFSFFCPTCPPAPEWVRVVFKW